MTGFAVVRNFEFLVRASTVHILHLAHDIVFSGLLSGWSLFQPFIWPQKTLPAKLPFSSQSFG